MPNVSISPQPKLQFFDAAGNPLVGGKLYTYAAGTTTPLASYTDSTGNVANTNPVVLDARGEASVWLSSSQYKLALYTASNVLVWTVDNVNAPDEATLASILSTLAASGGSELIGFLQAGSSAPSRTVQSKLRDVVSVKDFGAAGNGSTNDAAAFGFALTAASGKTLEFPPGTYIINSALTVSANTTIIGYGATLDFSAAGNITALTLESNVKLYGFKLIGPGNASYNGNSIGIKCYGTDNSPAAPTYVTGPTLQDLFVTEFAGKGVDCKYNVNGKISECYITECGYTGVQLLSCNRFQTSNNYIGQISPGSSGNAYGISVSSSEGTVTADPVPVFNEIIGNIVEDVTVWTGIDTHGGSGLVVSNNIVHNCKLGIKITDRDVSGVRTVAPKNIVVSSNYINDNGIYSGAAITINGAYPIPTADYASNISVIGNTILGHGTSGSADDGAIRCYSTRNLTISGNTLRQPKVVGILLDFDNESFTVSGNTIVDPNDSSTTTRCVYIKTSNNLGTIVGNTFALENSALATKVSEWAVENGSGAGTTNIVTVAENNLPNVQTNYLQMSAVFGLVYTAGATTPSVKNTTYMEIANASPTTITNFTNAYEGQVITLTFADANTTITRANAYLSGGVNFTSTANDVLTLKKLGSSWYEIGRSVNS